MIIYVHMNKFEVFQEGSYGPIKSNLEEISGEKCLAVYFNHIRSGEIEAMKPTAIIWGGGSIPFEENFNVNKNAIIENLMDNELIPQFAICYSFQLAGSFKGATRKPIGKLSDGEADLKPEYNAGYKKEVGVCTVEIDTTEEIFAGLPDKIQIMQTHWKKLSSLPKGFKKIAHSPLCEIQAFKKENQPFWGTQFHPESPKIKENYPHGTQLLTNFFAIAKKYSCDKK